MTPKASSLTGEETREWWRRKALCCYVWGCTPWAFDEAWDSGQILLTDVQMAVFLAMNMSPRRLELMDWMTPGVADELMEEARAKEEEDKLKKSWPGLMGLITKDGDGK